MAGNVPTSLNHPRPTTDQARRAFHRYGVYGIRLLSDLPLDLSANCEHALAEVVLRCGTADFFAAATQGAALERRSDWYWFGTLLDGRAYVRWKEVGQFVVSTDGREIVWSRDPHASAESFQVYLLGQALSFALVQLGMEPLHGTAIVVDGGAIALLGDTGYGKSTLAASFLANGASLLTDDLLLLERTSRGVRAHPGPQRLKLFPDVAKDLFASAADSAPMNSVTGKRVFALPAGHQHSGAAPLRAIYVLAPPIESNANEIRFEALSAREAFVALLANTFNCVITEPDRLRRQVDAATSWIDAVPIRRVIYPRSLQRLVEVREAILHDAAAEPGKE